MGEQSYSQVADIVAVITPGASAGPAQAKSRAVRLDVPKTLAVIALFRLGRAWHRAIARFVV